MINPIVSREKFLELSHDVFGVRVVDFDKKGFGFPGIYEKTKDNQIIDTTVEKFYDSVLKKELEIAVSTNSMLLLNLGNVDKFSYGYLITLLMYIAKDFEPHKIFELLKIYSSEYNGLHNCNAFRIMYHAINNILNEVDYKTRILTFTNKVKIDQEFSDNYYNNILKPTLDEASMGNENIILYTSSDDYLPYIRNFIDKYNAEDTEFCIKPRELKDYLKVHTYTSIIKEPEQKKINLKEKIAKKLCKALPKRK